MLKNFLWLIKIFSLYGALMITPLYFLDKPILFNQWDEKNKEWVSIPTKKIGENRDFVYYSTIIPSLSIFTITGSREIPSPKFEVSNLNISPAEAVIGEKITVSADIANLTDKSEVYTAVLWLNGTAEEAKEVVIPARGTKSVSFTLVKALAGEYEVRIDKLIGKFTIKPIILPGQEKPAQDLNGDGRYEDVNGNGKLEFADVEVFFKHIDTEVVRKNVSLLAMGG